MINWEAHACLRLHPRADFAPIERYRAAGGCHDVEQGLAPLQSGDHGRFRRTGMRADEAALVRGGNMMRVAARVWPRAS